MKIEIKKIAGFMIIQLLLLGFTAIFAQKYQTQIFDKTVKTLQIRSSLEKYSSELIELNSSDVLNFSFDQLSHNSHNYTYTVLHCNADWTLSNLNSSEYIAGYTTAQITEYERSVNTTFPYTHYQFSLPNNDLSLKISGNYVVLIYEDNIKSKPVAHACFSVVEPKVIVQPSIRYNTDIELNKRFQQLDFDVKLNGFNVQIPESELKILVRQNSRTDNEVFGVKPTYMLGGSITYKTKDLIFEAGNEFNVFDISSVYAAGRGVDRIIYQQPNYIAGLIPQKIQSGGTYMHEFDANGKFVINNQESNYNSDIDADYMYVDFYLPLKQPFFDGRLYVVGDFNHNIYNENTEMLYDFNQNMYSYRTILKQGGYNYQIRFKAKGAAVAQNERIHGSFWQTKNQYAIYVYYRNLAGRYDKLIAVKHIEN